MNVCRDTSDAVALYLPQRLYLKPTAKINISVQLPPVKVHGKSISNWELMEKLRKMIQPETFSALKVSKNSSDVIRFDAEIDNREKLERVISRLDDHTVKLNDYPDALKVRACEAKVDFPSRHAWDAFFRDAPNMDEMKPGERPDTVYLANLPIKWFVSHRQRNEDDALPNESIFRKVFEKFGKVRQVDVPLSDPFRKEMKPHMTGMQAHGSDSQVFFEGYVQFSEYVAFVRAMDALRGMKLLHRGEELAESAPLTVDFDKTKHMTDAAVKRRAIVRDRLAERQRSRAEKEKEEKEKVAKKEERDRLKAEWSERQKLEEMQEREERRKKKQLAKLMARERGDVRSKVAEEERRLVATQRRLQAVRLMEELFRRIEIKHVKPKKDVGRERSSHSELETGMRERIVRRIKSEQEAEMDKQRQRLQRAYEGSIVLRAVLDTKKPRARSPSASSVSSAGSARARERDREHDRERAKRVKKEKMTTPEREQEMHRAAMYPGGIPPPYGYPYQFPAPAYPYQPPAPSMDMYYGMGRGYYPPPGDGYAPRPRFPLRRGRGRALFRGGPRMPYFEGPNASHEYYKYFKRLSEAENAGEHDDRTRSRSRSRRRSYSRSRSRSRHRRYSRSRSRSSRSRSRSKSRRRRSYTRSRSHSRRRTHSRSRSHKSHSRRSRSRSRRSRTRSRSKRRSQSPKKLPENSTQYNREPQEQGQSPPPAQNSKQRSRSKSWSLPKETEKRKSWSKSPSKKQ